MLEVRGLQVRYGTILAVEHLDLHVNASNIVRNCCRKIATAVGNFISYV